MERTIFWSWQSDLDDRVTRNLIRYALDKAIQILAADLEPADRPSITSDTQGVAGTPDIVATILRKIDNAAVFVGDVTPIAVSSSGKACANPNVLLEMGWANKAITEHRVIQVWNTAFEGASIDMLPFDMRGRRGPLSFNLPIDADTNQLRIVRDKLVAELVAALRLALDQVPPPSPEAVQWQTHFQDDPDVWFDPSVAQIVTLPHNGSRPVNWEPGHTGYARLIPSNWNAKSTAKRSLSSGQGHAALLGSVSSINFGLCRGGTMTYWPQTSNGQGWLTPTLTQWFEKTGEIWGVGGGFLFQREGKRLTLATVHVFREWLSFLERNSSLALEHGGSLPIHVRVGINDLRGSWWPTGPYDFDDDGFAALEDSYEFCATLNSVDQAAIREVAVAAFNGLAAVYGVGPFTYEQIKAFSR